MVGNISIIISKIMKVYRFRAELGYRDGVRVINADLWTEGYWLDSLAEAEEVAKTYEPELNITFQKADLIKDLKWGKRKVENITNIRKDNITGRIWDV